MLVSVEFRGIGRERVLLRSFDVVGWGMLVWGAGDVCGYDDLGGAGVRYRGCCIGVSSDGGAGNGTVGGDADGQKTRGGGRRTTSEVSYQGCSSLRQRVGIPAGTVRGASVLGSARPSIDDSSNACDNERSDDSNNNNNNNDNNNNNQNNNHNNNHNNNNNNNNNASMKDLLAVAAAKSL